jgi:hypothetical protein
MEESGSENLDEELAKRKDTFLKVILSSTFFVFLTLIGPYSIHCK